METQNFIRTVTNSLKIIT